jgi:hypothetical protein
MVLLAEVFVKRKIACLDGVDLVEIDDLAT